MKINRRVIAMFVAEFLGTSMLTLAALAVIQSQIGLPYFTAAAVAMTLCVGALLFGHVSGGHFNPAITIGAWLIRKVNTLQAVSFLVAQFLGGYVGWQLFETLTKRDLSSIAGAKFEWRVMLAEMIGTFIFAMGVAAAIHRNYKGLKRAATVGASLYVGVIAASIASNAILNPALALGVQSWSRAYIVGPIVGSAVAMSIYTLLFAQTTTARVVAVGEAKEVKVVEAAEPAKARATRSTAARKTTGTRKRKTTTKRTTRK